MADYEPSPGDEVFYIPSGLRGIIVPRNTKEHDRAMRGGRLAAARNSIRSDAGFHIELEDGESGIALLEELLPFYGPTTDVWPRRGVWTEENVRGWVVQGWWPTQSCPCGDCIAEDQECGGCEAWVCSRCEHWVSWDLGAADDMASLCDRCWAFYEGAEKT